MQAKIKSLGSINFIIRTSFDNQGPSNTSLTSTLASTSTTSKTITTVSTTSTTSTKTTIRTTIPPSFMRKFKIYKLHKMENFNKNFLKITYVLFF
jgi:hypothetical protein